MFEKITLPQAVIILFTVILIGVLLKLLTGGFVKEHSVDHRKKPLSSYLDTSIPNNLV
ncbi:hypothetical protein V7087_15710 [Neobacillus niacini]|uniref:hypothetical protein n=1 Tax=Neobacillus niacini TaxID=86668 RepID=UPI002FFFE8CA